MSDSENDLTNVFNFQNDNTTVSAKGPHINIASMSFRNPMTSTMYMPRNFERQRYAQSVCDQRSLYYERETSPMSMRSARDMQPWKSRSYYPGGAQRSIYHGRSGSPMSVRSIGSNVSAADIANLVKNSNFSAHDLKVIYHACSMKQRFRRIEKRRHYRMYRKVNTRRSGYDSGELGSDSSISSDDCRSVKTTTIKDHMTNFPDLRNHVSENNMLGACTDRFKPDTFRNMISVSSGRFIANTQNNTMYNNHNMSTLPNNCTQKARFQNGLLLPSQRFNKSVASNTIPENNKYTKNSQNNTTLNVRNHHYQRPNNVNSNTESENEEIFSETVKENLNRNESQHKRSLHENELNLPNNKRTKLSSPVKNARSGPTKTKNTNNNLINFEFAKPALPAKKNKPKIQEKLIAKSSQPLTNLNDIIPNKSISNTDTCTQPVIQDTAKTAANQADQHENADNTVMSMRPSFIKRKLFTQRLDIAEKTNLSTDSLNSPQTVHSAMSKEKNKARRLVTTQSCLNRDVGDDNNLVDMINKIAPDCMNVTSQVAANQISKRISNNKDDDRWDVSSVISMCVNEDVSDTFTDEEISQSDDKVNKEDDKRLLKKKGEVKTNGNSKVLAKNQLNIKDCMVAMEKLPITLKKPIDTVNANFQVKDVSNTGLQSRVKSFWDTDYESDMECPASMRRNMPKITHRQGNVTLQHNKQDFKDPPRGTTTDASQVEENTKTINNTAPHNNTIDIVQRFDVSGLTIMSHRTSKKKKCLDDTCVTDTASKTNSNMTKNKRKHDVQSKSPKKKDEVSKENLKPKVNGKKAAIKNTDKSTQKPKLKEVSRPEESKSKKKQGIHASKTNNSLSNVVDTQKTSKRERPIRSCRTPSQNRSIEVSTSLLMSSGNNLTKSLRSRTINLSIENIQFHFKPKPKAAVNRNITQLNPRKSDVSFSLGDQNTPKTRMARTKGDFMKGRRKI